MTKPVQIDPELAPIEHEHRAAEAGEDWKDLMVEARNRLSRLWEFLPSEGAFGPLAQLIGRIDAYLAASPFSSRPAIIEECARVCDLIAGGLQPKGLPREVAETCAKHIRALAPGGQNAASQAHTEKSVGVGPKPAVAAPDFNALHKQLTEIRATLDAIESKYDAAPPAPAEVAEGAGKPTPQEPAIPSK